MKVLTSMEIFDLVWERIRNSGLGQLIPIIYADHYPEVTPTNQLSGEFIVLTSLSNVIGDDQVASVNVNVYVPDITPTINRTEQRYPNRARFKEIIPIALESLNSYPLDERYHFSVRGENLISEENVPYSFVNLKIQLINY